MSTELWTASFAGFLIGTIGALVIGFVRSALYDWWEESCAREAESIITPDPIDVAETFASECDRAAAIAEHTEQAARRLSPVGRVIPLPREASE